jgi:hypothetical protein
MPDIWHNSLIIKYGRDVGVISQLSTSNLQPLNDLLDYLMEQNIFFIVLLN